MYSLWIIIHSFLHFIIYLLKSLKPLWLLWPFEASRWHMRVLQLRKSITLKPWGVMWCSTYHQKWNDIYYPYRIVLPGNISKHIFLSIKQTLVHYPNLGSPTSHGHNSLTVRNYVTFHIPLEIEWWEISIRIVSLKNSLTFISLFHK